ncbi:hypothetical protein GCM10027440_49970 [Nocardiopsis coralliicola]
MAPTETLVRPSSVSSFPPPQALVETSSTADPAAARSLRRIGLSFRIWVGGSGGAELRIGGGAEPGGARDSREAQPLLRESAGTPVLRRRFAGDPPHCTDCASCERLF